MKAGKLISGILFFVMLSGFAGQPKPAVVKSPVEAKVNADTFPVPPENKKQLFYIQRSLNTNTIVYELNLLANGTINMNDPVHVFWLRYQHEGGIKKELTFIQKHYAYGIDHKLLDEKKQSFVLNLVSYKKRDIYLIRSENKQYKAYININGKMNELDRIFFQMEGDGDSFIPDVKYIELTGKDISTGKIITERFKPE